MAYGKTSALRMPVRRSGSRAMRDAAARAGGGGLIGSKAARGRFMGLALCQEMYRRCKCTAIYRTYPPIYHRLCVAGPLV